MVLTGITIDQGVRIRNVHLRFRFKKYLPVLGLRTTCQFSTESTKMLNRDILNTMKDGGVPGYRYMMHNGVVHTTTF